MNFNVPTITSIGGAVWSTALRTLTGLGAAASVAGASNLTLAATATIAISASSGTLVWAAIGAKAGAAGTAVISLQDGLNVYQILSIAAGQNGCAPCLALQAGVGSQIKNNDAANSVIYTFSALVLGI